MEKEEKLEDDMIRMELARQEDDWKYQKTKNRSRSKWKSSRMTTKRGMDAKEPRPSKRRKYSLITGWGEEGGVYPDQAKTTNPHTPSDISSKMIRGGVYEVPSDGLEDRRLSDTPVEEHRSIGGHPPPPHMDDCHPGEPRDEEENNTISLDDPSVTLTGTENHMTLLPTSQNVQDISVRNTADVIPEHSGRCTVNKEDVVMSRNDKSVVLVMMKSVKGDDDIPTTTPSGSGQEKQEVGNCMKKTFTEMTISEEIKNHQDDEGMQLEAGYDDQEACVVNNIPGDHHHTTGLEDDISGGGGCVSSSTSDYTDQMSVSAMSTGVDTLMQRVQYVNDDQVPGDRSDDQGGDDRDVDRGDDDNVRCSIVNKHCVTHQCDTKTIKVTDKKWGWIEKKKQFGYIPKKATKYICMFRISGQGTPSVDNSGVSMTGESSGNTSKCGEVGRFLRNTDYKTRSRSEENGKF